MTKEYSPRDQLRRSRTMSFTCCSKAGRSSSGSIASISTRIAPRRRPGRICLPASIHCLTVILPRRSRFAPRRSSGSLLVAETIFPWSMKTLFAASPLSTVRMPVSPLVRNERRSSGTLDVSIWPEMARSSSSPVPEPNGLPKRVLPPLPHDGLHPVDRDREDDRRVLLRRDLREGLEIAKMDGHGFVLEHLRGLGQLFARLELAGGVDDLGALLALRFGLLRHGPLHLLGEIDG